MAGHFNDKSIVFHVGEEVDVHPSYAREHPERDCSGQAVIVEVIDNVFGTGKMYGVAFPQMEAYFRYYWIGPNLLRRSAGVTETDGDVREAEKSAGEKPRKVTNDEVTDLRCAYCHASITQERAGIFVSGEGAQCPSTWYDHDGTGRHMGHSPMLVEETLQALAKYNSALIELNRAVTDYEGEYSSIDPKPLGFMAIIEAMARQIDHLENAVTAMNVTVLGEEALARLQRERQQ